MITSQESSIRIVVLDCVFDHWMDSQVREFFGDVLALRFEGYGREYPRHVIPASNTDYFGTHIVTCEEYPDGKLVPISSYRMVSMKRCQEFKRDFVGMEIARDAGAKEHLKVVKSIMEDCQKKAVDLGYCGSWTIRPRVRKNEILTQLIRNLVYCTHSNWQKENQVPEMLITGVKKFKTDVYQETIGYKRFQVDGKELETFGQADLAQEPVFMLHLRNFTDYCKSMAARYQSYWDNRLVLGNKASAVANVVQEAEVAEEFLKAA